MKILKSNQKEILYFAQIKTRIGKIYYTHDGKSLYTVGFSKSSSLGSKVFGKKKPKANKRRLKSFETELKRYIKGKNVNFKTGIKLLTKSTFEKRVLSALSKIPFGKTISYGDLAKKIKNPNSPRAVGNALGKNPCPIILPCHRIIKGDGSLGGFTGGLSFKRKLHSIEGIKVRK